MKTTLMIFLFFFNSHIESNTPYVDKTEAKKAFEYLNVLRTDQHAFSENFHLGGTFKWVQRPALKWNDTLARVAESKVLDMAKRKYFDHVNPDGFGMNHYINLAGYKLIPEFTEENDANYFESIESGATTCKEAINDLIIDAGEPSFGHRNHLLGITEWDSSLVDIGIGFAKIEQSGETYTCVLIAKHNW